MKLTLKVKAQRGAHGDPVVEVWQDGHLVSSHEVDNPGLFIELVREDAAAKGAEVEVEDAEA